MYFRQCSFCQNNNDNKTKIKLRGAIAWDKKTLFF